MLFITIQSFAVKGAPQILRACINSQDSIVTVSWKPPSDACASFTHYSIFASYNGGAFTKITSIPILSVSEYPHKINNSSTKWSYYIRVYSLCDGLDSSQSATLDVDILRPQEIQIDSVSYELTTQNIVAGWSPNPSTDTKLYKIYDFSSGNGDSIGVTGLTSFTVSTNPASGFPVVIASLDSCNLSSILSLPHTPARLSGSVDSCKKQITLSWSLYKGWNTIDSQLLFVSINSAPFVRYSMMSGTSTYFTYNNLALGDQLTFLVRSYTKSGSVTSSSNQLLFITRKPKPPQNLYLSNVNVNDQSIEVSFKVTDLNDAWNMTVRKGTNPASLTSAFSIKTVANVVDFMYVDANVKVSETQYYYQIETQDRCSSVLSLSNISSNMLLQIDDQLHHNPYSGWAQGAKSYELQRSFDNGSTWNTIQISNQEFNAAEFSDSSGCFRVLADEEPNTTFATSAISISNKACNIDHMTSYMVTGVNPLGGNNRFIVMGKGIDNQNSYYRVYNRWGELLVQKTTNEPWDLTYKGETIPSGSYIYIINLYGLGGEKRTEKGTLNVIQ